MEKILKKFSDLGEKPNGKQQMLIRGFGKTPNVAVYTAFLAGEKNMYSFIAELGTYSFSDSHNPKTWEIKLIDNKHPRYNKTLEKQAIVMNKAINKMMKQFK